MTETWDKVVALKKNDTRHKGYANNLTDDELICILGTVDYFGGSVAQAKFDMRAARYRVFDFLGMCVMGDRVSSVDATKVMVNAFLKADGDIDKWIADLRETDYDMNREWESLEL
jgi:hypothetical protein